MHRRALGALPLTAALLAGGLAPLVGVAGAAACPAWTDAKGDAYTGGQQTPVTGDDNLDIVSTTVGTAGGALVSTITVSDIATTHSDFGDEFRVTFNVGGKTIVVYADRDPAGKIAGIWNKTDDKFGDATAAYDMAKNTVTITAPFAELDKALGSSSLGKTASAFVTATLNQAREATVLKYDESAAPASLSYQLGALCSGGAAGVPAPVPPSLPGVCFDFTDPKGDAAPYAQAAPAVANDPDLDILGVTYQTTADRFVTTIRVDKLATRSAYAPGHVFYSDFTFNKLAFSIFAATYDPSAIGTARNTGAEATGVLAPTAQFRVAGAYKADVPVDAKFDLATSTVTLSVPRDGITKHAKTEFADGAELTLVKAVSKVDFGGVTPAGGDVTGPADAKLVVGSNACFGPAAAKLLNVGKTSVQYTDAAAVAAKLTSSTGKALAGKTVRFQVGSAAATARTGSDGVARAALDPRLAAGTYTLVTSFAGDATAGKVTLSTPFKVSVEVTKLALSVAKSGSKRTVTAKLLDDDRRPVAGQVVDWFVNGKKVGSARTSSAGVATLGSAKPGQTVLAQFAGVAGKYAASKSSTKA